jgi:hypothetical protein
MNSDLMLALISLVVLAIAHSALGEAKLIGPLISGDFPPLGIPSPFAKRVLRFAWHLTSVAWLGLAAALWIAPHCAPVVGLTLAISGVVTHASTRGAHFAWSVFLLGAIGVAHATEAGVGQSWISITGAVVAFALSGLHVAWALGVTWGRAAAIPRMDELPTMRPGKTATLLVAAALSLVGGIFLSLGGFIVFAHASLLALPVAAVFALRTVGDFRTMGLFRRPARDAFARYDALIYTPLCFSLAAALLWLR